MKNGPPKSQGRTGSRSKGGRTGECQRAVIFSINKQKFAGLVRSHDQLPLLSFFVETGGFPGRDPVIATNQTPGDFLLAQACDVWSKRPTRKFDPTLPCPAVARAMLACLGSRLQSACTLQVPVQGQNQNLGGFGTSPDHADSSLEDQDWYSMASSVRGHHMNL